MAPRFVLQGPDGRYLICHADGAISWMANIKHGKSFVSHYKAKQWLDAHPEIEAEIVKHHPKTSAQPA